MFSSLDSAILPGMIILPNGVEIRDEYEARVAVIYGFRCIRHPARWMTTLHHEPPRSLNPKWKEQPETWYNLCHTCHQEVHNMSRKNAKALLDAAREVNFPNWEKDLEHARQWAEDANVRGSRS
jgi:5-methylcytosine-specific restriction endonuclease McrA